VSSGGRDRGRRGAGGDEGGAEPAVRPARPHVRRVRVRARVGLLRSRSPDAIALLQIARQGATLGGYRDQSLRYTSLQIRRSASDADPALAPALVPPDDSVRPYKGLATFGPDDAHTSSGVRRFIADLASRLPEQRLLVVVGTSGRGKSSAIRGGLLPSLVTGALARRHRVDGRDPDRAPARGPRPPHPDAVEPGRHRLPRRPRARPSGAAERGRARRVARECLAVRSGFHARCMRDRQLVPAFQDHEGPHPAR
jgi:hypothetical protein